MLGKTEGIVLRTSDYGEGNKILSVYTKEMGKVGMMAQGARKTKSRFAAVSQPFTHAFFLFHIGSGLASLNQADLIQTFPKIRGDLHRTAYASYILELTDRMSEERQKNGGLYQLLLNSLNQLEDEKDSEMICRIYELKLLSMHGYKPILDTCASCGKGQSPWFFSIREGGLLCESCRRKDPHAMLLLDGVARILSIVQNLDVSQLGKITVKRETKQQLQKIMYLFMDEYTGIRLKTRTFIDQLEKMEQYFPRKENEDAENR